MDFADLVAGVDRAAQESLGGVLFTYQPEDGEPVDDVPGIFDENYLLAQEGEASARTVTPALWVRLEDLPVHPNEDDPIITVSGKTYRVRDVSTDGDVGGAIVLFLSRLDEV